MEFGLTRSGMELEVTFAYDKESLLATEVDVAQHYLETSNLGTLASEIDGMTLDGLTEAQIESIQTEIDKANGAARFYSDYYSMVVSGARTLEGAMQEVLETDTNFDGTIVGDEQLAAHGRKKSYEAFLAEKAESYYKMTDEVLVEEIEPGKEEGEATLMTLEEKQELLKTIEEMKAANRKAEAEAEQAAEEEGAATAEEPKTEEEKVMEQKAVAQYQQTQQQAQELLMESGGLLEETA